MSCQRWLRKLAAPLSIIVCVCIILGAYSQEYGHGYAAPPLLNTTFKYWTLVPGTNETKPYLWQVDFIKGPNDRLWVSQDIVDGVSVLGMHVYQDGLNDTYDWAMVHVRQDLRGKAASEVFQNDIGIWVYPTFVYHPDPISNNPLNAFGVEVNDGTHITWFIFSPGEPVVYQFKLHRIIIIPTPLNQWSYREINIRARYQETDWPAPGSFSFILITGATKPDPGSYGAYFKSVEVTHHSMLATQLSHDTWSMPLCAYLSRKK